MTIQLLSFEEAKAHGLKHYFTGKPCKRGHICKRILSGRCCVKCSYENNRNLRRKNPEHYRNKHKKWLNSVKNTPGYKAKNRERALRWYYNSKNREKTIERSLKWAKKNSHKRSIILKNNSAKRRGAEGSYTRSDVADIRAAQKGKCAYFQHCRTKLTATNTHVDHIIPIARGGSNYRFNIQLLCVSCNVRKNAKDPIDYCQSMGLLL